MVTSFGITWLISLLWILHSSLKPFQELVSLHSLTFPKRWHALKATLLAKIQRIMITIKEESASVNS